MADNITYSTISLNCNTKKRKTEEDTILSLTDDVNNVILSEDPLISAEFNVSQGYRASDGNVNPWSKISIECHCLSI
ncbi:hypothetical protein LOD99_10167 [Oopsacas minuta]|uniref:Uncharacterized protein n=1 Tax=Oopsacas minuta TaxID=111878 RepID=A0AAV7KIV8_9METZ|nr:hypothetical protein LOD99_10167 [Oopsacas minuta]